MSEQMETEEPVWTKVDMQKLLHAMRENIPKSDRGSIYTKVLRRLDWDKVAFHPYSSEACRNKWEEFQQKMRKIRTLTELIGEAEGAIENPFKGKNYKTHPEFPKKPCPPNSIFFQEQKAGLKKRHPDLSSQELMKLANDEYKALSEHKKAKYVKKYDCAMEEYGQRMQQLRKQYPKVRGIRRLCLKNPEALPTPHALWYRHERSKLQEADPDERGDCIRQSIVQNGRWRKLPDHEKLQWINRSLELKEEREEREREQHSEDEQTSSVLQKPILTSSERLLKFQAEGMPGKPPLNGYSLFCKEQKASLKGVPNTDYMVVCGQRWRLLTEKEKDVYNTRCRELKGEYEVKLSQYLSTLSEEGKQQILAVCGRRKKKQTKGSSSTARVKRTFPGEPKKPSKSGNVVFCSEQMARLKGQIPVSKDRLAKISPMWRKLSAAEKKRYTEIAEDKAKKYYVELQKWFDTLSADEKKDYMEQNPQKHQFLDGEIKTKRRKKKISTREGAREERPSDSEDIEDTSSEEEDTDSDEDEESSDEEDDEDGMTFGTMDMDNLNGDLTDTSDSESDSDSDSG